MKYITRDNRGLSHPVLGNIVWALKVISKKVAVRNLTQLQLKITIQYSKYYSG